MFRSLLKPVLSSQFRTSCMLQPYAAFSSEVDVNSDLYIRYKRLVYQSQQRGWLELDLIIGSYVIKFEKKLLNTEALDELTLITNEENSDLIRWFIEGKELPERFDNNKIMKDMMNWAYSPDKPWYPKNGNQ